MAAVVLDDQRGQHRRARVRNTRHTPVCTVLGEMKGRLQMREADICHELRAEDCERQAKLLDAAQRQLARWEADRGMTPTLALVLHVGRPVGVCGGGGKRSARVTGVLAEGRRVRTCAARAGMRPHVHRGVTCCAGRAKVLQGRPENDVPARGGLRVRETRA